MAVLGKWSGGTTALLPGTSYAAPNALFPTQDRNDDSAYGWASATSTVTLPASGLADGYLFVAAYELHDTSNGRVNPTARIIQASGTGTFVGGQTTGYARDTSEDRAYVRCWAFVDGPSASSTFQFQWARDNDAPAGGTERSEFQVIPLYYADVGVYSTSTANNYGGTTPNQVTGWSGTDGTNITLSSNQFSITGDNKKYLFLGSWYMQGAGNRTQRWGGLYTDSALVDAAKAYGYMRNGSNDRGGNFFTHLHETGTADETWDFRIFRGSGVAAGQGGADTDQTVTAAADHNLVILELNDSAEGFATVDATGGQNWTLTGPIDANVARVADVTFNDSASWTRASDTAMNAVQTADVLLGANVSAASYAVGSGSRWTAFAEFTINGAEETDSFAGNYLRGNQSTIDTFGWSANLLGFQGATAGDDFGVSVTELPGSEGGGGNVQSPANWVGFWGLNLDTLASGGAATITGTGAVVAAAQTSAGVGEREVTGTGAPASAAQASAGAGERTVAGSGATTAAAQQAAGAGARVVTGVGAPVGTAQTVSGAGVRVVTGAGASTAAVQLVSGSGTAGSGAQTITGTGAISAAAQTTSGTGTVSTSGSPEPDLPIVSGGGGGGGGAAHVGRRYGDELLVESADDRRRRLARESKRRKRVDELKAQLRSTDKRNLNDPALRAEVQAAAIELARLFSPPPEEAEEFQAQQRLAAEARARLEKRRRARAERRREEERREAEAEAARLQDEEDAIIALLFAA